jgi:ribose transport system permease protein
MSTTQAARAPVAARLPHLLVRLVYVAPVAMFVVLVAVLPEVLSRTGVMSLLVLAALLGIAAVGQTWAVMIGGIDLSIPATIGMANVLLTTLYSRGWSFGAALAVIVAVAVATGLLNGALAGSLGLHPLVVTLGVGSVVTGAVLVATGGNTGGAVPAALTDAVSPVGTAGPLPIPFAVLAWIVIAGLVLWVERRAVFGRHLYAVGANTRAARLAFVRPVRVQITVYVVSALCAAATGTLLAGSSGGASVGIGSSYLFSTITAVVVGGTSLLGGAGSYARTIAGVLVTTEFTTLLIGVGIGATMQQVLLGLAILVLITVYGRDRHVAQRL